jgi:hypothetical protein
MKAASLKPEVTLLDSKYIISHATCNEKLPHWNQKWLY